MRHWSIALGSIVAVVALVWLVMRDGRASALGDPAPARSDATRAADRVEANAITALRDGDTPSARRVEADASGDEPTQRPVPDGAPLADVLVVDAATDTPLAGVEVVFGDEVVADAVDALPDDERAGLARAQAWRRFGWTARTNGDGIARVHLGVSSTDVVASHGALYGELRLPGSAASPPARHRLALVPDRTLTVKVLDAGGRAAIHVPVAVARVHADGEVTRHHENRDTLPPDGLARFDHLQLRDANEAPTAADDAVWQVYVAVPGLEAVSSSFDRNAPPTEPIVLRLPPTGSLVVRLHARGVSLLGEELELSLVDAPSASPLRQTWSRSIPSDGWTRFAHVPLGKTFELAAWLGDVSVESFAGPTQPGEELRREFAMPEDRVLLIGRLRYADDTPVVSPRVGFDYESDATSSAMVLSIGAEGRFAVVLEAPPDGMTLLRGSFVCRIPGRPPVRHVLGRRTFHAGPNDLGDLRMEPAPLVASGRFVFPDGVRPFPVHFYVERDVPAEVEAEESLVPVEHFLTHQERDGRFVVTGDAVPGRLQLHVLGGRQLPIAPVEFVYGARDLVIPVDPGSVVTATVVLPDDWPTSTRGFDAVLRSGADARNGRFERRSDGRVDIRWRPIPRGTHVLEFYVRGFATPIHVIPDVVVPEPDGGDPRLREIDLRDKVTTVRLRSTDPEDRVRTGSDSRRPVAFPMPQTQDAVWNGHVLYDGELVLAVPRHRVDLLVAKAGRVPLELRDVIGTVDVTLVPWPEVELTFVGGDALPDSVRIEAQFVPTADDADAGYAAAYAKGSRAALLQPPLVARSTRNATLHLPVGVRARRLTVHLVRGVGEAAVRSRPLAHATPPIEPDAVHAEVRIAADEWRRALAEIVEGR